MSLATPDPLLSTEGIGAAVATVVADVYVLFGSSLPNAQQTALAGAITTLYTLGMLAYAAYVRGSRAKAGGLVNFTAPIEIASDATELAHRGK
jgi:hypothetical protein